MDVQKYKIIENEQEPKRELNRATRINDQPVKEPPRQTNTTSQIWEELREKLVVSAGDGT